jgi:glutamine phosphoribosylpyrophosphate amidotransferase
MGEAMCKILTILDIENKEKAEKFIELSIPIISKSDNDGLGVMRLGENKIYIQKWLEIPSKLETSNNLVSSYLKALQIESYEKGVKPSHLDAIAIHARQATCGINIENTHPFYENGTALIHNGIIRNVNLTDNKISTCDSEVLLRRYIDYDIKNSKDLITDINKMLESINGYYAAVIFNTNGIVDIFCDNMATLSLAKIHSLGIVIATTSLLIQQVAKRSHLKITYCYPLKSFTFLRWEKNKQPVILTFSKPYFAPITSSLDKEIKEYDDHSKKWWEKELEEKDRLDHIKSLKGI